MASTYLSLSTAVHAEPVAAAAVIKRVLSASGAAVTQVHRLGNQALVFTFELTAGELTLLRDGLAAVSQLLDPSEQTLDGPSINSEVRLGFTMRI